MDLIINPKQINWLSDESCLLFNPKYIPKNLKDKLPFYKGMIYIGTSSLNSLIIISKLSCLTSADEVNRHLKSTPKDIWLKALPSFHISGLSIQARSFLSGAKCVPFSSPWSAKTFLEKLKKYHITLTSLVPTQLYDIVKYELSPPPYLRACLIGGSAIHPKLLQEATKLKWPCLLTYGMTECGSQIATTPLSSSRRLNKKLKFLPHIEYKIKNKKLAIRSESLFSYQFNLKTQELKSQKKSSWFITEDVVEIDKEYLKFLSRDNCQIKISGKLVDTEKISTEFQKLSQDFKSVVIAKPHARKGFELILVTSKPKFKNMIHLVNQFNKNLPSHQQLKKIYYLPRLESGNLKKIKIDYLKKELLFI